MRDLSLHILDLAENSLRAGASVIAVSVEADTAGDRLEIVVEDNGPGFPAPADEVVSPFFTTKSGKRTGLGLSLMQAAAERAGGRLSLGRSEALGGARVEATMRLGHVDRSPLGDLGATVSALAATHPDLDVRLRVAKDGREFAASTAEVREELSGGATSSVAVAMAMMRRIKTCYEGMTF